MFDWIPELMKYIMMLCDKISFHYYVLSLFLFALIIKIILFPLSIKTQKNQVMSAKLRPKELAIRRKYQGRNDQVTMQKMNEELQAMYKAEGHNQFGGCLPMFIQLPVLFALYEIIKNPLYYVCSFTKAQIEVITGAYQRFVGYQNASSMPSLRAAAYLSKGQENINNIISHIPTDGSVSGVEDYSAFRAELVEKLNSSADSMPKFKFGFIDMSVCPNEKIWWYILIPVAVFAVYFVTMRLQRKFTYQAPTADPSANMSMKMMDYTMPALSAFISYSVPTAMAFYWIYKSILEFVQQVILSKMFPVPKMSDEEIRQMERDAEKAAKAARKEQEEERKRARLERIKEEEEVPRRQPMSEQEEEELLNILHNSMNKSNSGIKKAKTKDSDKK